jgi:hypothetical protein
MNPFIGDAFVIGVKEGILLYLSIILVLAYGKREHLNYLKMPLFAGVIAVLLSSFIILNITVTPEFKSVIVKMIGYVFGLFYLFSLGTLYHTTGSDVLGPLKALAHKGPVMVPVVLLLTMLYFAPDMAGSSLYVADLYFTAERNKIVFFSAAAGFSLALLLAHIVVTRVTFDVMRFFELPQILLFLALLKLVAGGVRGFAELSLIPSVQAGLMKLIHDMVHQTFLFLLVPDHPLLSTTTWNFIGVLFGPSAGMWLSLGIMLLPLILFIKIQFSEAVSLPGEISVPARKRIFIRAVRDQRVMRSVPVFIFMVFILSTWFAQKGESSDPLYLPQVRPLIGENGKVIIPLQSTLDDLRDGSLHKFSVTVAGEEVRLIVMKKPDGTLAVCLDACEICQPDGYGQAPEHVVCLYCKTPILFASLGKPGGCNPIPLGALVTDKDIQVELAEIARQREKVNRGDSKGPITR